MSKRPISGFSCGEKGGCLQSIQDWVVCHVIAANALLAVERKSQEVQNEGSFKMSKRLTLSAVVVLLMCSSAFAYIGQSESAAIGSAMLVGRVGGPGSAESAVVVPFGQNQYKHDWASNTTAFQTQSGLLAQGATAVGRGGMSGAMQSADIDAGQNQLVARPLTLQGEKIDVGMTQGVAKIGGIGGATAFQAVVGGQTQIASSPGGISVQGQTVGATQFSAVAGGPCSNATAGSQVGVDLQQSQMSAAPHRPGPPCGPPPCHP